MSAAQWMVAVAAISVAAASGQEPAVAAPNADALPGGGWGVAFTVATGGEAAALRALRLDASGAAASAPAAVARSIGVSGYSDASFGLAGDSVVWVAPPRVAGVEQVRAAPLP